MKPDQPKRAARKKARNRKAMETVAGAAIGAVVAGPVGAVIGGLVANKVDGGIEAKSPPQPNTPEIPADDFLAHAHPKRILVPLDFSAASLRSARFARQWAALFDAEIWLLHVVDPSVTQAKFSGPGGVPQYTAGDARDELKQLAKNAFPSPLKVKTAVRRGEAYEQIIATARAEHADIIIIATHGHTPVLKHILLGSTAERVARQATCPVLILRSK